VDQWEADRIVPKSIWRGWAGGFLCPAVDPAYGGLGGDFRYSVIVAEELARTAHTGLAAALHSDVVVPTSIPTAASAETEIPSRLRLRRHASRRWP
jgi:acyl-CoA dehydrogenase